MADLISDVGDFFNGLGKDANQVLATINSIGGVLNPTGSPTGGSTTGTGGTGIPLSVNLSADTKAQIDALKTPIMIFLILLVVLILYIAFKK